MERQAYLKELLQKFLDNNCSERELGELFNALQNGEIDADLEQAIQADAAKMMDRPLSMDPAISQKIRQNISTHVWERPKQAKVFRLPASYVKIAAAVVSIVLMTGLCLFFLQNRETVIASAYGEKKQITLPDQSVVTLHGNSSIRYAANFKSAAVREVYLQGEAFFSVVKTASKQKFIVHTTHHVDVEVLGTQFNVSDRKAATQVVLKSGKVKLGLTTRTNEPGIYMKPGDLVEVSDQGQRVNRKQVDPEIYASWRNNQLIFKNATLREILTLLEENYGYEIRVNDPSLLNEKFTAAYPSNDIRILVKALTRSFDVRVNEERKQLFIGN